MIQLIYFAVLLIGIIFIMGISELIMRKVHKKKCHYFEAGSAKCHYCDKDIKELFSDININIKQKG